MRVCSEALHSSDRLTVIDICERDIDLYIPVIDGQELALAEAARIEQEIKTELDTSMKKVSDLRSKIYNLAEG